MRVLFIGGTGSVSSSCSNLAIKQGIDLWLLNRGDRPYRISGKYHFIKEDVTSESYIKNETLKKNKWDCVVNWNIFSPEQALADIHLFKDVASHYIYLSTTAVYKSPQPDVRIKETDPAGNQVWPFASQKLRCEHIFLDAISKHGFPVTIVRPGHTYSEFAIPSNIIGLGYGLVELLVKEKKGLLHNDGLSKWTLTHSDDFAVGFNGLLGREDAIGEVFHITGTRTATWKEIFDLYAELLDTDVRYIYLPSEEIRKYDEKIGLSLLGDKDRDCAFDNSKIRKFVKGFSPETNLRTGLERSLKWHDNNKELVFKDPIYCNVNVLRTIRKIIEENIGHQSP